MTFQTVKLKMGRAGAGLARSKEEKIPKSRPAAVKLRSVGAAPQWAWAEKGKQIPKSRPASMKLASFC